MKDIVYEKKGEIAYITLNRPDKLNAITPDMADELTEIWKLFRDDNECLIAILSGAGRGFCSGASVEAMATENWSLSQSNWIGDGKNTVGPNRHKIWKPIIAALHGRVFGGGLWLALECDLRIAADNTVFCLPEPKVGIPTLFTAFLTDFIPRGIAAELLFRGNTFDAQRAYDWGILNKIVPHSDLMAEAASIAEDICKTAPLAVRAMKEMMLRTQRLDPQEALRITEQVCMPVMASEDVKEGRKAFVEKRPPKWKGR